MGAGQVIKGWDQGLLDMCVSEKRKLTIPPDMGYGKSSLSPRFPALRASRWLTTPRRQGSPTRHSARVDSRLRSRAAGHQEPFHRRALMVRTKYRCKIILVSKVVAKYQDLWVKLQAAMR